MAAGLVSYIYATLYQTLSYAACTRHTNFACFFIFIVHLIHYNHACQKVHGNRFHMDSFVSSVWSRFWSGNHYGKCTKVLRPPKARTGKQSSGICYSPAKNGTMLTALHTCTLFLKASNFLPIYLYGQKLI